VASRVAAVSWISWGNPPKNPSVVKVENSMKEFLHEKEQIHRQPDHGYIEAGRDGYCSA
jgi:hypothetical protein